MRNWFLALLMMAFVLIIPSMIEVASAAASTQEKEIEFPLSITKAQQKTIAIKGLLSIEKTEVDNGTVSYSRDSDNVTVTVNNGTSVGGQYKYKVKITYTVNTAPSLAITQPLDQQSFGMAYSIPIKGEVLDPDTDDKLTVFYQVDNDIQTILKSVNSTGIAEVLEGEISLSELPRGKHTLQIWVEDDKGAKSEVIQKEFRVLSSNSILSILNTNYVGTEVMRPAFKKEITGYSLSVENVVDTITVTPSTEEAWSTLKVNGTQHDSSTESPQFPLKIGTNDIKIEVTAEDGQTKKNYLIRVTRLASKNTALSNLVVSDGTLTPAFDRKGFEYTVNVPYGTKTITVTPKAEEELALIKVNNVTVSSGAASKPIPLQVGSNSVGIRVTAPDGETTNSTQLTIIRGANSDARLSTLRPSIGGLSPSFTSDQLVYSMDLPNEAKELRFTATASDTEASIRINGNVVLSGEESSGIQLNTGDNTISVDVIAQDGTKKEYVVQVKRAVSTNNRLKAISFTDVNMRPVFSPHTQSYVGTVLPTTTATTVLASTEDTNAKMKINGKDVQNDEPAVVNLGVGQNVVIVHVISPSGEERTYQFTITRPGSSNALLADLWLSIGDLDPTFSSTVNDYTVNVGSEVDTIQLTAIADDNHAKIKIKGEFYGSGETTVPFPISTGKNVFEVQVIAGNGVTTNTYSITVQRELSNSSDLKELKLSYGAISPVLTNGQYNYEAAVPYSIPSVSVIASAEQGSKITVNGKTIPNGGSSSSIGLAIGSNTINIVVTSPDMSKTSTYRLLIKREAGNPSQSNVFMVSPIDTQLVAMFTNPTKDHVTGELWRKGKKEATATSRSNTIVFGSNGKRISVMKGEVYTVKITYRSSGVTLQETVTALGSADVKASPVRELGVQASTPTSTNLSWKAPADKTPATEYTVTIYNQSTGKRVQSVKVKDEFYQFKKPVGGGQFRFEVQRLDIHRKPSGIVKTSE